MKEMIQTSVHDIIHKRKEDRRHKSSITRSADHRGNSSEDRDQRYQFYKEKVDEFEGKFKENEQEKRELQLKLRDMERAL